MNKQKLTFKNWYCICLKNHSVVWDGILVWLKSVINPLHIMNLWQFRKIKPMHKSRQEEAKGKFKHFTRLQRGNHWAAGRDCQWLECNCWIIAGPQEGRRCTAGSGGRTTAVKHKGKSKAKVKPCNKALGSDVAEHYKQCSDHWLLDKGENTKQVGADCTWSAELLCSLNFACFQMPYSSNRPADCMYCT